MAMSASNQAIVGGTVLRIPAIQSPDYVPGVSGWIIRQDGSAEFNNGTFRGTIEVGPIPGQHFIVNNPATGDVIDVYDSSNKLIYALDGTGRVFSYSSFDGKYVEITNGFIQFGDTTLTPVALAGIASGIGATENSLVFGSGQPPGAVAGSTESIISMVAGTAVDSEWIEVGQRGTQGALLQTDLGTNANQLIHTQTYTATVSGAGGMATFSHVCNFTPVGGLVGPLTHFSQWNWNDAFGVHGFTATQAQITMFVPSGAVVNNGVAATFHAMFWG